MVTIVIVIMVAVVLGVLFPRLNAEVEVKNRTLGVAVASQIESFLQRSSDELENLVEEIETTDDLSPEQIRMILDISTNTDDSIQALYLLDSSRRVIDVGLPMKRRVIRNNQLGADFSRRSFMIRLGDGKVPLWSDTYLSSRGLIVVSIALPIKLPQKMAKGQSAKGFLVGEIDLAEISRFAGLVSDTGHVLPIVIDRRGNIIGHPDANRSLRQENLSHIALLNSSNSGAITGKFELNGETYIGTRTKVNATDWTALVAQPAKVAFGTMYATLLALIIAACVSLSLALIAAYLASKRISQKVAEFGSHMQAIADGNYRAPMPHSANDDIERLSQNMHKMADAVLEREARLSHSKAQYQHVVDSTHDLITRVDKEGDIIFVNGMSEIYFGLAPDECIGKSAFGFVFEEDQITTRETFEEWLRRGSEQPMQFENRQQSVDGRVHQLHWSIVADRNKDNGNSQITGFSSIGRDVTAERAAEELLAASEQHYRDMFQHAPLPYQSLDLNANILQVNEAWLVLFGVAKREEVIGRAITDFIHEKSLATLAENFPKFFMEGHIDGPLFDIVRPDGSCRTVIINGRIGHDANGKSRTHCILTDITERLQLETEQKQVDEQLALAASGFSASAEGILITDANQKIISVNPALELITGFNSDDVIGQTPSMFNSGRHDKEYFEGMWQQVKNQGFWRGEIWNRRKNGEIFPEWLTITAVSNNESEITNYIGSFFDISERKKQQDHIEFLAHHDALTSLPNRTLMDDRLRQAIAKSRRNHDHTAVLFVDLDRFKVINDSLGHDFGDRLLACIAQRLPEVLRETETVSRLGGDEFVIIIPHLVDISKVALIAQKIVDSISRPIEIDQRTLHITPSIGISIYPDDGEDPATLLRNADTAMYHAKDRGRNNYQFFTSAMNLAVQERMTLENDLRLGLERGEFELHYQPQVDGTDGITLGFEALIRWRHPERGLIAPNQFIPVAEETGLIVPIGAWVLQEACMQAKKWHDSGRQELVMCVNLSARQFQEEALSEHIESALTNSGLSPEYLELELTESILMVNPGNAIELLQRLAGFGIRMAIDDFGTGYSSLAYLKLFPVHRLKIDRSFVRDLTIDPNDAAIVEAIIAMARSLKLSVIAEGVETDAQMQYLIQHGCVEIQGYHFSKPRLAIELDGCNFKFPCE